jgi:prepilin-type N-terminal cleavage/methylation domain-containing protein
MTIDRARSKGFRNKPMCPARALSLSSHAGFTLIDIMVVIVILGILAALVIPRIMIPSRGSADRCGQSRHRLALSG